MKSRKAISFFLVMLLLASNAGAQTGDWQAVKELPPGTPISVKGRDVIIRNQCTFRAANDYRLVCEGMSPMIPPLVYPRDQVRQVRLERSNAAKVATGALVGIGIGVTLGALGSDRSGTTRGGRMIIGGGILGLIGGAFGRMFPVVHGPVIYRGEGRKR